MLCLDPISQLMCITFVTVTIFGSCLNRQVSQIVTLEFFLETPTSHILGLIRLKPKVRSAETQSSLENGGKSARIEKIRALLSLELEKFL